MNKIIWENGKEMTIRTTMPVPVWRHKCMPGLVVETSVNLAHRGVSVTVSIGEDQVRDFQRDIISPLIDRAVSALIEMEMQDLMA